MRRELLAVACFAFGCGGQPFTARIGDPFDVTVLDRLEVNVTTGAQVLAWWGDPHQISQPLPHEPCEERWHYSTGHAEAGASTTATVVVLGFEGERLCQVNVYRQ